MIGIIYNFIFELIHCNCQKSVEYAVSDEIKIVYYP
jgi:hypothetical protein